MFKLAVVTLAVVACAHAYSSGAPESACQDMVPRHPVSPQKSPPPYALTTNTQVAKSGSPVEVTIRGKDASNTIRGLMLQARQGEKIVGTFTIAPNDPFAQGLNCGEPNSAVTHKKNGGDKQQVTFTWTPPRGFTGEIKFRATIAYNGAVFWVGVQSPPVQITA